MYAASGAVLGGYSQDLPIVVFSCVEELYRTGKEASILAMPLILISRSQGSTNPTSFTRCRTGPASSSSYLFLTHLRLSTGLKLPSVSNRLPTSVRCCRRTSRPSPNPSYRHPYLAPSGNGASGLT